MLSIPIGNGLYLSQDRSRVRATPEVETKAITAPSYTKAYELAFGTPSPYIGDDKELHTKLVLERAGFTIFIISKSENSGE